MDGVISVCIPVFNGEDFLRETIDSVLAQSYRNFEIIVKDNCSTDSTGVIIESLCAIDSRVKLLTGTTKLSLAENWNDVASKARGEYMMLLSADDLLEPDFLKKCVAELEKNSRIDAVSCNHFLKYDNEVKKRKQEFFSYSKGLNIYNLILLNPFSINFTVFRRKSLESILLNNGKIFREPYVTCDYDLWLRLVNNSFDVFYIKEILGKYRVHNASMSSNKIKMIKHTFLVFSKNSRIKSFPKVLKSIFLFRLLFRLFKLDPFFIKNKRLSKVMFLRLF